MDTALSTAADTPHKPFYTHLYVQVLTAIVLGVLLGHFYPHLGEAMKPLGDGFIKLIKMLIAPIIFCTVVHGIASMEDMKKVGRVGLKALIYFEVLTTVALIVGLIVVNILQPGVGMNVDARTIDTKSIQVYTTTAGQQGTVEFLMHIIPNTVVGAFAEGEILQVLFFAILFAFGLFMLGERGRPVLAIIDIVSHALFGIVSIVMKAAPIGAFGAMAFTIGKYGVGTLLSLAQLMIAFYVTCLIFVLFVLGRIAWFAGFNILKFIRYIKEELLIVLGTSSSKSVLPRMIAKLENLGCKQSVVGLVIPTGYSFNLDGTCIYLTMAAIFLAQATNTDLTIVATARHYRRASAYLEGRGRRNGVGLHRAGSDPRICWDDPGGEHCADPRCRSFHVGGPRADQFGRQRRRDGRCCQMGRRARRGSHAPDARSRDGTRSLGPGGRNGSTRPAAAAAINLRTSIGGRPCRYTCWPGSRQSPSRSPSRHLAGPPNLIGPITSQSVPPRPAAPTSSMARASPRS